MGANIGTSLAGILIAVVIGAGLAQEAYETKSLGHLAGAVAIFGGLITYIVGMVPDNDIEFRKMDEAEYKLTHRFGYAGGFLGVFGFIGWSFYSFAGVIVQGITNAAVPA